jgi:hypothetical protein
LKEITSMKTSTLWATIALAAASLCTAMPLTATAQDYPVPESDNCSNLRTITSSRCVHYNEKNRDGWANQQANQPTQGDKLGVKYGTTVLPDGTLSPFGPGRDAITKDMMKNGQAQPVDIWYQNQDGSLGVKQVWMTAAQMQKYYTSPDAMKSMALDPSLHGGSGGKRSAR